MITYKEFYPAVELRKYIKCYWVLDSNNVSVDVEDIILPCGCLDILLQKENVLMARMPSGIGVMLPRFVIGPQGTAGFTLGLKGRVKLFGVRLLPHAAASVFGFPATELRSSIWAVRDIFTSDYSIDAEELINTDCIEVAIKMADRFFMEKMSLFQPFDFMVNNVSNSILAARGDIRLQDIFCKFKATEQTLRNRFLKQVGICPRDFISIVKFQHAVSLLNSSADEISLTNIALSAGYYDQAHFIRVFKQITGLTPGQYCKEDKAITRFFISACSISNPFNSELKKIQ